MAGNVAVEISPEEKLEKLRFHHYSLKIILRLLMAFEAPSQLFMFLYYIIPYLFEDYSQGTRNVLSFFVILGTVEGLYNYFCVILCDPSVPKKVQRNKHQSNSQDRPTTSNHMTNSTYQNGVSIDLYPDHYDDDLGLQWRYCDKCECDMPPRSWHCDICQGCILKRDHHCFMVGNCIGLNNQKYFAVLALYALLCGWVGGYFQYKYLQTFYYPESWSWTDFLPPFTMYRWLFGRWPALTFHIVVMICQIYLEFLFGTFGFLYFTFQMTVIAKGYTAFEMAKMMPVRNTNSRNFNFRTVFGDYWALNFVLPMSYFFPPKVDGIKWEGVKIDHNA
ncbi:putative ZDHHC-type palmitoyltransferase 4 isoform X1 [Pecten maximus]|uniref:putative ZDHHC-type palmitoyltransferase 4 isoform X1 n=1 Tax=Pecten maximus TaxID=6579 RepID=UPI0014586E5E|nr:putative ZDHHC-type palmitoyltransferase 4 isoform X1 [Pecten maximus]